MKNFAAIRILASHQVLAYTEAGNDGCFMHIHYRLRNGTNIGMKMTFDTEKEMWAAFRKFTKGGSDTTLTDQIKHYEKTIKVESTR